MIFMNIIIEHYYFWNKKMVYVSDMIFLCILLVVACYLSISGFAIRMELDFDLNGKFLDGRVWLLAGFIDDMYCLIFYFLGLSI
jgi:hypothetical protein